VVVQVLPVGKEDGEEGFASGCEVGRDDLGELVLI